ncbi:MAG TPA: GntR family transcriptional regulator [Phycisphaerae bacterium]|nr:GntR family transcriptional regulator [Phycisphaerae bacterium]HOJ74102.1 GntR family transcriptional regulator [Phycisphaerae bacterium]HOM50696.1 GntR family transcriptional regulator [Phycisphaerae bacterium]HON66545.1 GntR family transcriptional regulator [Phycisphaerae bacterium]HOQ86807.1 GntR family transcriptional regulator [Phycisphaerae bacterium]
MSRAASDQLGADENPGSEAMRERAYRQLRHMLILQQIPAGKRLREAEWTARLKVNRSALREAFARLEAQGLIEAGPKTGYVVPTLDRHSIREILAVRIMLETGAIEIVCTCGLNTPQHLQPMRDACDQMERLASEGDIIQVAEADWQFHDALVDASRNRRLRSVYHHAPLPLIIPEQTTGPEWEVAVRQTVREHRAILDAILAGKPDEAIRLLRSHISERSMSLTQA